MRKPLASRIIGLAVIYCVAFCIIVILQFSNRGYFSHSIGGMTIRGRYLQQESTAEAPAAELQKLESAPAITGGVKITYGGLEFNLKEERGKGLMLTAIDGTIPVNPEYMILTENSARFILPGGTIVTFNLPTSTRGPELQINTEFANNISEIAIPIASRRSSLIRENGQLGIMYGGFRYFFTRQGREFEDGKITLSRNNTSISYRARSRQRVFDPDDYIIARAQNYESVIRNWRDTNFSYWNQNAAMLQNESDITAFLSEALTRGNFMPAVNSIPGNFINSPRHSYISSVFLGGMTAAYRSFISLENEKLNLITRLTRERSLAIFQESHILDYLFSRGYTAIANEIIEIINNAEPQMLTADYCAGLLEAFSDLRRWRPEANNPIEHLTEQILFLVSENLNRDNENDLVLASFSGTSNFEYSLRLGKALVYWADTTKNTEWLGIGRSLVLSAITSGNAGRLHDILKPADFTPRAAWLTNEGHWAWTASQNVRASYIDGNLNLAFSFPANNSHYVMIRGVRPFIRIQIHGMDWRSDSQFERYDSSGWVYYPQDQVLVLKLRHRLTVENVRIIYRAPPPVVIIPEEYSTQTTETTGENID
jgi:hypothetical protein